VRAAIRDRYGPPEIVQIADIPKPEPVDDQIVVKVLASSINRADLDSLYARWGFLRLFLGLRAPRNQRLGADVAGIVEAVGPQAKRLKPGDEVFGDVFSHGYDAFSEYSVAPEKAFATKPAELSLQEAATMPHSAILALQGLRKRDGSTFHEGARVLVVGASGSVGPFAVQIAKARGAHVTAVARADKHDLVRALGADELIDYESVDYTRDGRRYDWILDVNAHHSLLRWRHSLRPGGTYYAQGSDSAAWFAKTLFQGPALRLTTRQKMALMLHWKPFDLDDVDTLKRLVSEGRLKPVVDRSFPLDRIAEALRYFDDGHARGKVVITP
jgi:NADPH:quinone reductase-like Zn-dependent oxidoreductase